MKMRLVVYALASLVLLCGTAYAGMKYECWAYKNNKPHKMVHVVAENKGQAVDLACDKFKKLDILYDYVKCK